VLEGAKRGSRDWAANYRSRAWLAHRTDRLAAAERLSMRPDLAANLETTDRAYIAACRKARTMRSADGGSCRAPFTFPSSPSSLRNTAGSGRGPWYIARSKALSVGLSNVHFKSLGLPSLIEWLLNPAAFLQVFDRDRPERLAKHYQQAL
jgi:hypothetical protein